jgi:hypothetical protein
MRVFSDFSLFSSFFAQSGGPNRDEWADQPIGVRELELS